MTVEVTERSAPRADNAEGVTLFDRIPKSVSIIGFGAAIVLVWYLVTASGVVSHLILPTPQKTLEQLIVVGTSLVTGGYVMSAMWITTQEVLWGFAIAVVAGILLGVLVSETRFGERAVMPYLVALDTMPKIAFAPLFVAWFGFNIESKIALAVYVSLFPVIVGTAAGVRSADENSLMLFRTMGVSRLKTLLHLKIPAGAPQIFTGLKIASLSVMAGAITAEFLGGGKGVGELIRIAASQLDTARVFALIIYLSLLGVALFGFVTLVERRVVFWRNSDGGRE